MAAHDGLTPLFIGSGRAVVAAALATVALLLTRPATPTGRQWARLTVVVAGVVVGFPLLTSYALARVAAGLGALAGGLFAASQHGGLTGLSWADPLLVGAVLAAAVGYADGGLLSRQLRA